MKGEVGWERENREAQMPPCKKGDGHFLVRWEREKTHMGCEGEMFRPETNIYWKIEGLKVVRRGMTNRLSGQSTFSSWWHPYEFLPAFGRCFGRKWGRILEKLLLQPCSAIMAATFSIENGHGRTFMGICYPYVCDWLWWWEGAWWQRGRIVGTCFFFFFFLLNQ